MKIGDILIFVNNNGYENQYYTVNKHYPIYKIEYNFIPTIKCGYIKDDNNNSVYFKEDEATNNNWKYLKKERKEKLKKLKYENT